MNVKKAYVVGTNVSTSLSPSIFQYWFNKYNIDGKYGYKEIKENVFDEKIKSILKEEGLCGLNITIPFKEKIIPYLTSKTNEETLKHQHPYVGFDDSKLQEEPPNKLDSSRNKEKEGLDYYKKL